MLDWSHCTDVERIPGKVSGAWLVVGTRIPADAVIDNAKPKSSNGVGSGMINTDSSATTPSPNPTSLPSRSWARSILPFRSIVRGG